MISEWWPTMLAAGAELSGSGATPPDPGLPRKRDPRSRSASTDAHRHGSVSIGRLPTPAQSLERACTGLSCRGMCHAALRHPFVLLPNCLIDDPLRVFVPRLRAAAVTDFHWNRDTTDKVPFVCPLPKCDLSIALDQAANPAKSTAPAVISREHDPQQSGRNYASSFARFCWAKCELFHIWRGKWLLTASWSAAAASKQRACTHACFTGPARSCSGQLGQGIEYAVRRAPSLAHHLRSPPRFG